MKLVVSLFIFMFGPFLMAADLEISAIYSGFGLSNEPKHDGSKIARTVCVAIVIKNIGTREVIVPTSNIGPSSIFDSDGEARISYLCSAEKLNGAVIKRSLYEFLPVRLLPGEVAIIEHELNVPAVQSLDKVRYIYEVSSECAAIYGFWAGKVTSKITLGTIEPKAFNQVERSKP